MMDGMRRLAVRAEGRRFLALATIGLALVLLLAACGQSGSSGIPTASESQGAAAANPSNPKPTPVAEEDAALVYAQCIRANGFPEWPDPDSEGRIMIIRGAGMNMKDPRRLAAMEACQDLRPAGAGGGSAMVGAGGMAGAGGFTDQEQALAFARCMRENGVPDFPDPSTGGGITVIPSQGQGGLNPNDPKFQAAMQTCRASVLGGGQ